MRKSNWLVVAIAVVLAILLVVLYLTLDFGASENKMSTLFIVLWFVVVIIMVAIVAWREAVRKRLIRRFYISADSFYNSELGGISRSEACSSNDPTEVAQFIARILEGIEYGFEITDRPDGFEPLAFVESKKLQIAGSRITTWEGTVNRLESGNVVVAASFSGQQGLADALAQAEVL